MTKMGPHMSLCTELTVTQPALQNFQISEIKLYTCHFNGRLLPRASLFVPLYEILHYELFKTHTLLQSRPKTEKPAALPC